MLYRSYLISGLLILALFATAQYRGWSLFSASEAKSPRERREGFTTNKRQHPGVNESSGATVRLCFSEPPPPSSPSVYKLTVQSITME